GQDAAPHPAAPPEAPATTGDLTTQAAAATVQSSASAKAPASEPAAPAPSAAPATAPPSGTATTGHDAHTTDQGQTDSSGTPSQLATTAAAAATAATTRPGTAPAFEVPKGPVALPHAAEAVQRAIELAARQGVNQARSELSPASLGTVRIHLQRTEDGVVARVVAGHEAAQAFHQNADELRRSLQSHGVNLLRLHIETGGRGNAQSAEGSEVMSEPTDGPATTNLNPAGLIDVLA